MRILSLLLLSLCLGGCAGLSLPHTDLVELQRRGDTAYAQGDYVQAAELYRQLGKAMPADADVRYRLGNSLARQEQNQPAVDAYREALLRDPQHAKAWHNLLQVQSRELVQTASEMQRYLNPQTAQAAAVLMRADQLLDALQATAEAEKH